MINVNQAQVHTTDTHQNTMYGYETEEISLTDENDEFESNSNPEVSLVIGLGCEEPNKLSESLLRREDTNIESTPPSQVALLGLTCLLTGVTLMHLIINASNKDDGGSYVPIIFYVLLGIVCVFLSKVGPTIPAVKSCLDNMDLHLRNLISLS
ncbi:hypothetical protein [Candidatus Ichthyocystis sparus]|uniref:hypothetical protein n=2 Tax=Candidatus Ichthyocystis sparus TaxID=1561004 RepID=UPI000B816F9F|nr:hypothetical protein [Candidatus Ichthyocystis sparus]